MPTPNMPDEELDSVFRRVADEYSQDPPPPGAWERLETQLATATTSQQLRGKVLRGLGAELSTLAVLLWLGYQLLPQRTQPASVPAGAVPAAARLVATEPSHSRLAATAAPASPTAMQARLPRPATGAASAWASPTSLASSAPGVARHRQAAGGPTSRLALPGAALNQPGKERKSSKFSAGNILINNVLWLGNTENKSKRLPTTGLAEATAATRVARLELASYPLPAALAGLALPPADSTKTPQRPAARPPYRLVLGLLGAPAFSAVRTPQTAQLGGDYGLTLEYVLAPRVRVRAGLISSQKRYHAASTDYEAPAAWQWFPGNYQLDANCRITEIPLDVRFDVLRRPTYAVFTSLGINSLLMRNERYSYDWTMNGQTFTKTAQVLDGSNHFLSVLNVSVGVERPIGGRWSAQVEPFWQIPLGGVGAGQVRLSSAGAAFSLKFGLTR